jgi:hypothetical protein
MNLLNGMVCFFVMYIWIIEQPNAKKDQILYHLKSFVVKDFAFGEGGETFFLPQIAQIFKN